MYKAGFQIKEVIEEYKQALRALEINVKGVILYGSYALGSQREDSDIDILIDYDQPIGIEFIDLAEELEKILHRKVDLVSKNGVKPKYLEEILKDLVYV